MHPYCVLIFLFYFHILFFRSILSQNDLHCGDVFWDVQSSTINMPRSNNCSNYHPNSQSGPCRNFPGNDSRYTHLIQKRYTDPDFYEYVKAKTGFDDFDCICRKCELRFRRAVDTRKGASACLSPTQPSAAKYPCTNIPDSENAVVGTTTPIAPGRGNGAADIDERGDRGSGSMEEGPQDPGALPPGVGSMTPGILEHKTQEQGALNIQKGWELGAKGAGAGSNGDWSRELNWPGASTPPVTPSIDDGSSDTDVHNICFLAKFAACHEVCKHTAPVDKVSFQSCFSLLDNTDWIDGGPVGFCQRHYNMYQRHLACCRCTLCQKTIWKWRDKYVSVTSNTREFQLYMEIEKHQPDFNLPDANIQLCTLCYKSYNSFCTSGKIVATHAQTKAYLQELTAHELSVENNVERDHQESLVSHCYQQVLRFVVESFLADQAVLLPHVYNKYIGAVDMCAVGYSAEQMQVCFRDVAWLFRMLSTSLGPCLLVYSPLQRSKGRMLYRNGSDMLASFHSSLYNNMAEKDKLVVENKALLQQVDDLVTAGEDKDTRCIVQALTLLRSSVKEYASRKAEESVDTPPDISAFDYQSEIQNIDPLLWNFIFRLTATDQEDKIARKNLSWDQHYRPVIPSDGDTPHYVSRMLHRVYICSCLFHTQNSRCSQPLHILMTDVSDKYSNSSTSLLTINSRVGAGVSKDSHRRFVTRVCSSSAKLGAVPSTVFDSFTMVSFDNLDKNQTYASVFAGKERGGFHGTTVQVVQPMPESEHWHETEVVSCDMIDESVMDESPCTVQPTNDQGIDRTPSKPRQRTVPSSMLKSVYDPPNAMTPECHSGNRFAALSLEQFASTDEEKAAHQSLESSVYTYMLTKHILGDSSVVLPGLKQFISSDKTVEKSTFHYMAILDEAADSRDTVLKVLNMVHDSFQADVKLKNVIVVGDGKSYDHLIKLKAEYGESMSWLLPYPGDWHILKNVQPVLMKIYFDAGLKELAAKHHHGATLKLLMECSKFAMTHHFLQQVWEAMYRRQIQSFLSARHENVDTPHTALAIVTENVMDIVSSMGETQTNKTVSEAIARKYVDMTDEVSLVQSEFAKWREECASVNKTFAFWDRFVHVDMISYLALHLAIRNKDWQLRMFGLKRLAGLFHAFDRQNYLRMIPYHLADLLTFPPAVIKHLEAGAFATSILGQSGHCVAVDECHEMVINRETKEALKSVEKSALASLALYLPYRAKVLHHFNEQLQIAKSDDPNYGETSKQSVKSEEITILSYMSGLQHSTVFSTQPCLMLNHIFTCESVSPEQMDSLMNFGVYGDADFQNYLKCVILNVSRTGKVSRQRRNLKTYTVERASAIKQKQAVKDQNTVIACLRKQIAWSKATSHAIEDLDQLCTLPRILADEDGFPAKGQKSSITYVLRALYGDSFLSAPPSQSPQSTVCLILEGMFIINTVPLGCHKTFADYAEFLFQRWITRGFQEGATEVHLVFDHPHRHGVSPKDLERQRRDKGKADLSNILEAISGTSQLPKHWANFLSQRKQKRLLVNFLSTAFLELACSQISPGCLFTTAGGFDDERQDQAMCIWEGQAAVFEAACSDHEEGDSRVWVHAAATGCSTVIIYSPDTDTYFVGLPLVESLTDKTIYVQLKDAAYEKLYINMNLLVQLMKNDLLLQGVDCIEQCWQMLYIVSGCDYVSYFRGFGKKTFVEVLRRNVDFICGRESCGKFWEVDQESGVLSFFRLVGALFFNRYRSAFQPEWTTPKSLLDGLASKHVNPVDCHREYLVTIRDKTWDRVTNEVEFLPTAEALTLHWSRSSWVSKMWSRACQNQVELPSLTDFGWRLHDDNLEVVWDVPENINKVEAKIKWYTKGCGCETGCDTNRCKCRKSALRYCGPGCSCHNCRNLPAAIPTPSTSGNVAMEDMFAGMEMLEVGQLDEVLLDEVQLDEVELSDLNSDVTGVDCGNAWEEQAALLGPLICPDIDDDSTELHILF
jgi:hypothetical protein